VADGTRVAGVGEVLLEELLRVAGLSEQSERRLLGVITQFLRFVDRSLELPLAEVCRSQVERFVHAPDADGAAPSIATSHLRRSAVRLLFRVLRSAGQVLHDPTLDLVLPPRSSLAARPLTDDEVVLGRSFSEYTLGETRHQAAWALAETTARTSELPVILPQHVDLGHRRVWIPGSTKTDARWGALSDWGVETLDRRLRVLEREGSDGPIVYGGQGGAESRQASSCAAIADTLRRAGLTDQPDVRPISVAAWAGRRVLEESGRIELAAAALGVRSLDAAARLVAWDWQSERAGQ
jgi:integrase/recombinase XerC